ncbi:hypothetical protein [Micromonospora cremea]|uniref:hypothetical protein n=1 Tax=Micromonospora cremea TaxID=709881 RepID=UPI000941567B|nr:hypothetical protein [Micromonospora cremea]
MWNDWQPGYGTKPIHQGTVPRLLTWGVDDFDAALDAPSWNAIAKPRYRAVYGRADHDDSGPHPGSSSPATP